MVSKEDSLRNVENSNEVSLGSNELYLTTLPSHDPQGNEGNAPPENAGEASHNEPVTEGTHETSGTVEGLGTMEEAGDLETSIRERDPTTVTGSQETGSQEVVVNDPPEEEWSVARIAGAAVGGGLGLCLLLCAIAMVFKKKKSSSSPPPPPPATPSMIEGGFVEVQIEKT